MPSLVLVKEVKEMTTYEIGTIYAKQGLAAVADVEPFLMDPSWSSEEVVTFLKGTKLCPAFDFLTRDGLSKTTFYICTTNGNSKELVVVPEVPTGAVLARYIVKRKGSSWREATVYIGMSSTFGLAEY
jgi:hypothetical protein